MLTEMQKTAYRNLLFSSLSCIRHRKADVNKIKQLIYLKRTKQKPENDQLIPVWESLIDQEPDIRKLAENIINETIISWLTSKLSYCHIDKLLEGNQLYLKDHRPDTINGMTLFYMDYPDSEGIFGDDTDVYRQPPFDEDVWEAIEDFIQAFSINSLTLEHNIFFRCTSKIMSWYETFSSLLNYYRNVDDREPYTGYTTSWRYFFLKYEEDVDDKALDNFHRVLQHSTITSLHLKNFKSLDLEKTKLLKLGQAIRTSQVNSLLIEDGDRPSGYSSALIYMACEAIAPGSKVETLHLSKFSIEKSQNDFLALCEAISKSNLRSFSLKFFLPWDIHSEDSYKYLNLSNFSESDWTAFLSAISQSRITFVHIDNLQEEKYREYRIELENILEQNARKVLPLHCPIVHSFWEKGYALTMKTNKEVSVYQSNKNQPDPITKIAEDLQLLQEGERITVVRDHLEILVPQ